VARSPRAEGFKEPGSKWLVSEDLARIHDIMGVDCVLIARMTLIALAMLVSKYADLGIPFLYCRVDLLVQVAAGAVLLAMGAATAASSTTAGE
jgi:hypothetical protein